MKITKKQIQELVKEEITRYKKIKFLQERKEQIKKQLNEFTGSYGFKADKPKTAKFSRAGTFNDIYVDEDGVEYADVDGTLNYMTKDWEEPISPARNVVKAQEDELEEISSLNNRAELEIQRHEMERMKQVRDKIEREETEENDEETIEEVNAPKQQIQESKEEPVKKNRSN